MDKRPAGLTTEALSWISSSGKGGWFHRISKRQSNRHLDNNIFNIENSKYINKK